MKRKSAKRTFKDLRASQKKTRTDPFDRALNLARKKYDKMELDRANAVEKIEAIDEAMPGLRNAIAGLESYFGMEPTFPDHELSQPRFNGEDLDNLRRNVPFERTIDRQEPAGVVGSHHAEPAAEDNPTPRKKVSRRKAGVNQLYVCKKCGRFTASADEHPLCVSCGSNQLEVKQTAAISMDRTNTAGVKAEPIELTPAGDDDQFLSDKLPGTAIVG